MSFEFKPVKLGPTGKRSKRGEKWSHVRKTILFMAGGAIISLGISYFTGNHGSNGMNNDEISNALLMGAFLGFFITNSPCARGRC